LIYNSILEALADGNGKLNEISSRISFNNSKVAKYLETLIDLKIVEKIKRHNFTLTAKKATLSS